MADCDRCTRLRAQTDRYVCQVCDAKPPQGDYQATHKAWAEAQLSPRGFACFQCFIYALGRPVVRDDFVEAPVNAVIFWTFDLLAAVKR